MFGVSNYLYFLFNIRKINKKEFETDVPTKTFELKDSFEVSIGPRMLH